MPVALRPARGRPVLTVPSRTKTDTGRQPQPGMLMPDDANPLPGAQKERRGTLRRRAGSEHITHGQAVTVQRHVRAAITLLDWLTAHGLELGTARQGDLDTWLTGDHAAHHGDAGNFVRWARRQKLTSLDFAATRWDGPSGIIDTEARWHHARRLLHDDTLKPGDRVAGLLVLLYAQGPAAISRLTLDQVHAGQQHVRLRLGREPVVLPEPLGALVLQVAASRRGHAALGDQGTSPWLFPGGQPGQPVSAYRMAQRLRQLGIHPGPARSTALFGLAAELPAALLARLLGIHISVAVAWQRASSRRLDRLRSRLQPPPARPEGH